MKYVSNRKLLGYLLGSILYYFGKKLLSFPCLLQFLLQLQFLYKYCKGRMLPNFLRNKKLTIRLDQTCNHSGSQAEIFPHTWSNLRNVLNILLKFSGNYLINAMIKVYPCLLEAGMMKITGRFTRLGQQFFPGIMFETVFHPFNFIIML